MLIDGSQEDCSSLNDDLAIANVIVDGIGVWILHSSDSDWASYGFWFGK